MIRVEKKSWGGWLCSCAHHLRLERPRPSLVVPGLQNPVRWLRKTCRHSGGLGDEQGAVGMGLGGQGTRLKTCPRRDVTHPTGGHLCEPVWPPDHEQHMTPH